MFQIYYGLNQKVMLDSRYNSNKQMELSLFDQQFSVWFTFHKTSLPQNQNIFSIMSIGFLLLRVQLQQMKLLVIFNQDQFIEIQHSSLEQNNEWFHLIVKQNLNQSNDEYIIQFTQPFIKQYSIKISQTTTQYNQTIIIVNFHMSSFCLIYDSVAYEIQPIIKDINMQQMIIPLETILYQYYYDSYFQVFLKKYSTKQQYSHIINVYYQQIHQLRIWEYEEILKIFMYQDEVIRFENQFYRWFRICISFFQNNIQFEIQFIDEYQSLTIKTFEGDNIFYILKLYLQQSNYQFMRFTQYFKVNKLEQFDQQYVQSLDDCEIGLRNYFDYESNACLDYINNEQIKVLSHNIQFDNSLFNNTTQYEQIGKIILTQLLTNISIYENVPFLELYEPELQNQMKEPFLLWKLQQQVYCVENYFGNNCQTFIKKCITSKIEHCLSCQFGFMLIWNQCTKCPKNCLICTLQEKQLKCLLPKQNYFINNFNQAELCKCQICNTEGQCVTYEQINNQIDLCFQLKNCLLKQCQNNWEYYSLVSQKCILLLNQNQFKLFYYLSYLDEQFYEFNEVQYIILQNYQLSGSSILHNQQLSNYYFAVQLIEKFQRFYNKDFYSVDNNYYSNKFNLKCVKKKLNQYEQFICKEYVKEKNNKCEKLPCLYKLQISNISYFIGSKNYVEHNNFEYSSINELLSSVKEIGIQFYSIYLEIYFILQNDDTNQSNWEQIINLKQNLNADFNQSFINLNLKFFSKQNFELLSFIITIVADKIQIINQFINFNLQLIQNVSIVQIANLTIHNEGSFRLSLFEGRLFVFDKIQVYGQLIVYLENIKTVEIKDYQSFNESVTQIIMYHIEQLSLSYSHIFSIIFLLDLYQVSTVEFQELIIEFNEIQEKQLINLLQINTLILKNISIFGQIVNDSSLITFDEITYTNIQNCYSFILFITDSVIFSFKSLGISIYEFNSISEQILNSTLVQVLSYETNILQFKFNSQIIQLCPLIQFDTVTLIINIFQINQNYSHNIQTNPNYIQGYLISCYIERDANIMNLQIDGIQLYNFGLLIINSKSQIRIFDLKIINIVQQNSFDNKFIVFKDYQSASQIIISGFLFSNILIENQIPTTYNLIEVQNYAFAQFFDCILSGIYSNNLITQSQIFQFDCKIVNLNILLVTDCRRINLMQIESNQFMIKNFKYENNKQEFIFKVLNKRPNHILIKNSTFQLNNQFILFVNSTRNIYILVKDIKIYIQAIGNYFMIQGLLVNIQLQNINIEASQQQTILLDFQQKVFQVYYAQLFVQNLTVRNLFQPLFYFLYSPKIEIQDISLLNINLITHKFLIYVIYSRLLIYNINIISIQNCQGIFFISIENNLILFQNIKIKNSQNITHMILFQKQNKQERVILRDISISETFFGGELFCFYFNESQELQINHLFITQTDSFSYNEKLNKLTLQDSLIQINNFTFDHSILQLINSEIIFNSSLQINQIQLNGSYIFNNLNSSVIYDRSFLLTLSFNRVSKLKTIKLNQQDGIKFFISQNGQFTYYFYVPSGQKLQEYKKLNYHSLSYQQIYNGLYIVAQGFLYGQAQYKLQCSQSQQYNSSIDQKQSQYFQISEGFNEIQDQIFIINPHNSNYTVFEIICSSNINSKTIKVEYNLKSLPCQLGEYLFQNQCLECNISQNQYSVTYNSTKCNYVNQIQIKSLKKGLLQLNLKYWRYTFSSNIIENCNSNDCNGGWIPGDESCVKSRLGALCKECDLYNIRGDGLYTNNNQQCQLCQDFNIKFLLQLIFTILWQLFIVMNGYFSFHKLSQQYLMFRIGFRQYYQILYRQSIDQPNIFLKMFTNYIIILYAIRSNLDFAGYIFLININIINNPGLILKAQLDCLMSKGFQIEIIYSQFIFQVLLVFFILSLSYAIYFMIIQIKKIKCQLGLILYITEVILLYNQNLIIEISSNLLAYKIASGQKWIKQNMQYLFYSDKHMLMIYYIIPVTAIFFVTPFLFPLAMKIKRIYAAYYQEYKPQCIFWEYVIIYTKYAIIIFQTTNDQYNQYGVIFIWSLIFLSSNLRPYYLQKLNQFELNLYILYAIQLNVLIIGDYLNMLIIILNLFICIYFVNKFYISYYFLNLTNIIKWKQKIIQRLKWFRRFSAIEKDQRLLKNKIILINLIRFQILKKEQIIFTNQSELQTQTEIELGIMIRQVQSKMYPSRQEPNRI